VYLPVSSLRAGLYGRNSKGLDKSIDDQIVEGRQAGEDNGWSIVAEYSDGVSASRFGRKVRRDWHRLLSDLDAGLLDVIITWEPSRADRDLETWVAFVAKCRARGVLIHITGEDDTLDARNASHWRRLIEGGLDAAMESEKISKRVRRGVAAAAVAGAFHGDTPYGYERVIVGERQTKHGPKPVKEQRPHPEHAPIVVEIFERLALSEPINSIMLDLNRRGVLAPNSDTWSRTTIRRLALNLRYLGQRTHKGEAYEGTWPALVSAGTFYAVRTILTAPGRKTSPPGRVKRLLSYLATCPCGELVHFVPRHGRRIDTYGCVYDGCVSIGAPEAEEYVIRLVVKRVCRPDIRDLFTANDDGDQAAARAKDEAARLRAKVAEATESFYKPIEEGGITAETLAKIEQDLKPRIADADRRSVSTSAPASMLALLSAAELGAQHVRPAWDDLSVAAQREILKLLFDEIHIAKSAKRLTRWATPEDRLRMAHERIAITWRKAPKPGGAGQQRPLGTVRPHSGGARAQRRREASTQPAIPRRRADTRAAEAS
jgi:DNA invertase Pin-like site-specific DNA recombinase